MVLFVLTMLLVALMVVMTLSFATKVRERIELQTAADATAFSNAVATARTFNNIAVLNRTHIAHGVVQLGAQSLISWTTLHRAYLNGARQAFRNSEWPYAIFAALCACAPFNGFCAQACRCGTKGLRDLRNLQRTLQTEDQSMVKPVFDPLDAAAGRQVFSHQAAMLAIYAQEQEVYQRLKGKLDGQELADEVLNQISAGGTRAEWDAPSGAGSINEDEVSGGAMCSGGGAVCDIPLSVGHAVEAAMGSRGWRFTTNRDAMYLAPHMIRMLQVIRPPDLALPIQAEGSSYFTNNFSQTILTPMYAPVAGADDEGSIFTLYNHIANGGGLPCPPVMPNFQDVTVELKAGLSPVHRWYRGQDQSPMVHFLLPCTGGLSSCPGVWPTFLDYNFLQVMDEGNNFGQPKNFAVIRRDSGARNPDPWNLFYKFQFNDSSEEGFDASLNARRNVATAVSTGVTYYHRGPLIGGGIPIITGDHWSEPPNLLNPYWRATLVAPDVDDSGLDDMLQAIGSGGAAEGRQTVQMLLDQGYGGYR
jgi:hypothetical protein